jgi:hypothetical protein
MISAVVKPPDNRGAPAADMFRQIHRYLPVEASWL